MSKINEIAERYVEAWAALSPFDATEFGIAEHDHEVDDLSPSYNVGERIWLEARDDARRQGADFDLKTFHKHALNLGSLGLDPFREAIARRF